MNSNRFPSSNLFMVYQFRHLLYISIGSVTDVTLR